MRAYAPLISLRWSLSGYSPRRWALPSLGALDHRLSSWTFPPLLFGFHLCMSFLYFPNLWQNVFSACLFQNDLNKVLLWWHLQMFPVAVTCGNTFVLKPSEKDPGKVNRCVYVCRIIQSRMRLGSFLFPGMCMIIGCFFLWTAWYYDDLVPVHYRICICAILTMYVAWELLRKSLAKRD